MSGPTDRRAQWHSPLVRPLSGGDDLHALTALLHRAYAALAARGLNYTAVDQSVETTQRRIAQGRCLIAEVDSRVVGTVLYTRRIVPCEAQLFTRVASVHQFAVDPPWQGAGIGAALMAGAEALAREDGESALALDTAEQAHHLIAAYTRWGFVLAGHVQWPGKVYRSVLMLKPISDRAARPPV
jgi:GNAT superfamily N-acetyltransferase